MEENTFLKMPSQSQIIVVFDKMTEIVDKIDNIENKIDVSNEKLSAKIESLDKKISRKRRVDFGCSAITGFIGGALASLGRFFW
jgi:tetrahydromethanopterin S-methyltransferase subunit G